MTMSGHNPASGVFSERRPAANASVLLLFSQAIARMFPLGITSKS